MKPFINKILFIILSVLFTFVFTGCNHASSSNPPVDNIVYLKKLTSISEISSKKSNIEKIVFSMETYSGTSSTFDCSDTAGYFTGVLENNILTVYGNGHRIYAPVDSSFLFYGFSALTSIEFNNFYTSKTTNMMAMFTGLSIITELNLSNFDTSKVTNMQNMFQSCKNLTSLNISSFDTSAVTNMSNMFYNCQKLTSLDVSKFNTSKVTNMNQMFGSCYQLTEIDISTFRKCEDLADVSNMFNDCKVLKTIYVSEGFNLSSVKTTTNMFNKATNLVGGNNTTYNLSNIDGTYAHIDGGTSNPGYFTLKQ